MMLMCSLYTVLGQRFGWAVLASVLYRPVRGAMDIVMAVAELYMAKVYLPVCEKELGSARFLAWTLLTAGGTNTIFLLLMRLLHSAGTCDARFNAIQGLWPLIMAHLTTRALDLPNMPMNVLGFVDVPNRWYPLSMAIGLSALNGTIQWETFAAIAFGYAYRFLKLDEKLLLKRRRAKELEQHWCPRVPGLLVAWLGGRWMPADDSPPPRRQQLHDSGERAGTRDTGTHFQLFGGTGRRLGD